MQILSKPKTNGVSLRLIQLKPVLVMLKIHVMMREIALCFMTFNLQTKRLAYEEHPPSSKTRRSLDQAFTKNV